MNSKAALCHILCLLLLVSSINAGVRRERVTARPRETRDYTLVKNSNHYDEINIELRDTEENVLSSTLVPRSANLKDSLQKSRDSPQDKKIVEKMEHLKNISLTVRIKNQTFILDLTINRMLLASTYKEIVITKNGQESTDIDLLESHCYYKGTVRGYENSLAAVSTCDGIVGVFYIGNQTFMIEPEAGSSGKHRVYKNYESAENEEKSHCEGAEHSSSPKREKRAALKEWPQDLDKKTRVIEMYIVNDKNQFERMKKNSEAVLKKARDIINVASSLFHKEDIYIVIVGQEVWTTDKIPLNLQDSAKFLADFAVYRQTQIKMPHDHALYLTSLGPFKNDVAGKAYLASMCALDSVAFICFCQHLSDLISDRRNLSGLNGLHSCEDFPDIVSDIMDMPEETAVTTGQITAHEIGHNFGLDHTDNDTCPCDDPSNQCIMDATASLDATEWSTCNKKQLTSQESYNNFTCLMNIPKTIFDTGAVCGNGLVETGEDCDCGKAPSTECNPSCCDKTTCRLIATAQCAYGKCCDVATCKRKANATPCRESRGVCDVTEYCTGSSALCPTDTVKKDYTACTASGAPGFCYEGDCRNRNSQCAKIFGINSTSANDQCYARNTQGIDRGNCGFTISGSAASKTYSKCSSGDIYCGTLFCKGGEDAILVAQWDTYDYADATCRVALFGVDMDRNLGYPLNGSPCGDNKACINRKCLIPSGASKITYIGTFWLTMVSSGLMMASVAVTRF